MPAVVPIRSDQPTSLLLVSLLAALVAFGQLVVILSFAGGWFLVSPSLTAEEIANGEGGFQFSYVTGFAAAAGPYAFVVVLIGLLVSVLWRFRMRLRPEAFWCASAALAFVIPAQQTILGSLFN